MNGIIRIGIGYEECTDREELAGRVQEAQEIIQALRGGPYEARLWGIPPGSVPPSAQFRSIDAILPTPSISGRGLIRLCALAEAAGLPRIGIGLRSAVLGSDRVLVRRLLSQSEVQLALFRTFTRSQWEKDRSFHLIETELTLGYPCQVRPAAGWGMAGPEDYVQSREELEQLVDRLMTTHDRVIAEEVIEGRLFVAAVLNGQSSQVIGVGELLAAAAPVERAAGEPEEEPAEPADDPAAQAAALARRRAGEPPPWTRLEMPGEADRELAKVVRRAALKAAAALHLAGAALFYYQVPKGRPPVLLTDAELAPSLGPRSLYARLWAHSGGSYRELAACLVENGL